MADMEEFQRRKYEAEVGFLGVNARKRRGNAFSKMLAGLACLGCAIVFGIVFILSSGGCVIVATALN